MKTNTKEYAAPKIQEGRSGEFLCTACLKPETYVERTFSFSDTILRQRRCRACGHVQHTGERNVDYSGILSLGGRLEQLLSETLALLSSPDGPRTRKGNRSLRHDQSG